MLADATSEVLPPRESGASTAPETSSDSPPPVPPPDPEPQPVPPTNVTQMWEYPEPSTVSDDVPVRLIQDVNNLTVVTSYGKFGVEKARPYFVRLQQPGGDTWATFTARFQGTRLRHGNGSYETSGTIVRLHYTLYRMPGDVVMGNMSVSLAFQDERNKITARFRPAEGQNASDFRIAWVAFTSHRFVVTADPSDREKEIERLGPLENNSIGDTGRVVTFKATKGAVVQALLDFRDAQDDWEGSFAGRYQFGEKSGNAAMVVFRAGQLLIDPVLVASPSSVAAVKYSTQRKTFFDGERYWLFWYDGAIKYTSSADGTTWSSTATDLPQNPGNLDFSFTALNLGRLVALVWVGKDGAQANKNVALVTGQIPGESIKWSTPWAVKVAVAGSARNMRTAAALDTTAGRVIIGGGKEDLTLIQRMVAKAKGWTSALLPGKDAEVTVLTRAGELGELPRALGTTRTICSSCQRFIEESGGIVTSKWAAIWPGNVG